MIEIACTNLRIRCSLIDEREYAGPDINFIVRMRRIVSRTYERVAAGLS